MQGIRFSWGLIVAMLSIAVLPVRAQSEVPGFSHSQILSEREWRELEQAMDRGLAYLATRQRPDGSFETDDNGQPAITSLAVLAFLSRGYSPGEPPYGEAMSKAIDYVLTCQQPDGLLCRLTPDSSLQPGMASHTGTYNHAIAGLMLAESYGFLQGARAQRVRDVIDSAVAYTLELQHTPKRNPLEEGGWRYLRRWMSSDSDMSVTSWHLMFLRSARNAGFLVPGGRIEEAMHYIQRSFSPHDSFYYALSGRERQDISPAIAGAGILSLSLGGMHQTVTAKRAGLWLLDQQVPRQFGVKRFFYKAFYSTQAMFQLGPPYWEQFFPPMLATLLRAQRADGSWPLEPGGLDAKWGLVYPTALVCLTLGTPFHLLPIFQR